MPCRRSEVVVVKVVDLCPPNSCQGTIDLSQEAFASIADPNAGDINIQYQLKDEFFGQGPGDVVTLFNDAAVRNLERGQPSLRRSLASRASTSGRPLFTPTTGLGLAAAAAFARATLPTRSRKLWDALLWVFEGERRLTNAGVAPA
ncbi:hypothetical protein NL676_027368 [Syzygium grande]|nr:hypothetical protein NL676_027368 [Syzygium grande]